MIRQLEGSDHILHAGDIDRQEILDILNGIAPVHAVRGNADKDWAKDLPINVDLSLGDIRICMAHKKKDLPKHLEGYDLAITGHTHKYDHREVKGVVYLNPGSCGPRRVGQEITLAVMRISDGRIAGIEKIIIPHEDGRCPELTGAAHAVDKIQIEKVIRLIQRRRSAVEIARQLQLDERITEQVVRLYLTHPGVDAEGIMAKMGL